MEAMPAMTTAVSAVPVVRDSKERLSSSMAKTTPASGVLKAAATRAARQHQRPLQFQPRQAEPLPQHMHDGGAYLHRRPLSPDGGAAGQAEQGQQDFSQRDAQREDNAHQPRIGQVQRRDDLRDAAALRAGKDLARQQQRYRQAKRRE